MALIGNYYLTSDGLKKGLISLNETITVAEFVVKKKI